MSKEDDLRWKEDGTKNGWHLPPPASWPLRLWGVRHIRALVLGLRVQKHNALWSGMGAIPTGYDEWVLYAILRGWA